jgi:ribosomal protein S18 acetylase RimI-like enzyme
MPTFALRPATPDDAEAIAAVWHGSWADGHRGNVPPELEAYRTLDQFRARVPPRLAMTTVAVIDGAVVGMVMVVDDEIEQVYVTAAARGTGVAAALLAHGEHQIAAAGHPVAWLAVAPGNARARRFYERSGWTDTGGLDYPAEIEGGSLTVPVRRYEKRVVT